MSILPRPEMSISQMERAALTIEHADNPLYVRDQLFDFFALSRGQRVAIRELAKVEMQRRLAR
jgi:hypothetical protein